MKNQYFGLQHVPPCAWRVPRPGRPARVTPELALVAPEPALVEIHWKIYWKIHWKIYWKIHWKIHWKIYWKIYWKIHWKIHWEIHWKIHWIYWKIDWENNIRHRKPIRLVAKITLDTANLFVTWRK